MNTPCLFLDFDGVLNFYGSRNAYRKRGDTFGYLKRLEVPLDGDWFKLNYSSDLVNKLNALKETTGFHWLWHTTWLDASVNVLDPRIGTNSDGFLLWDAYGGLVKEIAGGWGGGTHSRRVFTVSDAELDEVRDTRKYAALLANLRENPRPFVWIDDSATRKYDKADFVDELDVPHLVIRPAEDVGIVHWEFAKIVKFFTEHSMK